MSKSKTTEAVIKEIEDWIQQLEVFNTQTGYFGKPCSALNLKLELMRVMKDKIRRLKQEKYGNPFYEI